MPIVQAIQPKLESEGLLHIVDADPDNPEFVQADTEILTPII